MFATHLRSSLSRGKTLARQQNTRHTFVENVTVGPGTFFDEGCVVFMKALGIPPGNSGHHAVQFYSDEARLCVSVTDFLADGLAAGQAVVIIATPAHREKFLQELTMRRFDLESLLELERVLLLDAENTLASFIVNGHPNAALFKNFIGKVIAGMSKRAGEPIVRMYGELVDVLWKRGESEAALKLETLWNELAKTHSFSLLCGYAMGGFYKNARLADVCSHHTHVHDGELA